MRIRNIDQTRSAMRISLIIVLIAGNVQVFGQLATDSLFSPQEPLKIRFTMSIKDIRNPDSIYINHLLFYQTASGQYDSIRVKMKRRGNYRLRECYFPPLWIKIDKKNAKNTLFEGNKKLKLVLACDNSGNNNVLILKEFLCYKLYEEITPFAFQARLADVELTEKRKKNKTFLLKGILVEDLDKVAKRLHSEPMENVRIVPSQLNDTSALRYELFQFMISNTDWSALFQHNSKLVIQDQSKIISLMYDFDMSGLVNAPYAVVSEINGEQLPVKSVRERIYRGYCHPPEVMQFVRQEFIARMERLLAIPDQLKGYLSDKEIKGIKNYLMEFFDIIKSDRSFKTEVLNSCLAK
jgi:hypothetical protein